MAYIGSLRRTLMQHKTSHIYVEAKISKYIPNTTRLYKVLKFDKLYMERKIINLLDHIFISKNAPEPSNSFTTLFFSFFLVCLPIFCFQDKMEDFQVVAMFFLVLVSAPAVEIGYFGGEGV